MIHPVIAKSESRNLSFDEESPDNCSYDDTRPVEEIFIPSKGNNNCMLRLVSFLIMITTAMGPSIRLISDAFDNNGTNLMKVNDNNNHRVGHRYHQGGGTDIPDTRTFNVILNYRIEARIVGINDYGELEHMFGFSERFVDVVTGQEAMGDQDIIELHDVDPKFAHLTIRSLVTKDHICDYQYSLRLLMGDGFGKTDEFKTITSCSNNGLTYTIMVQVSITENQQPSRRVTGKTYDIHFMNHIFEHQYDDEEGWHRVESSNTYRVRRLSLGDTVRDPSEPELKTITLLEDGPNFVIIKIVFDNQEMQNSYQYFMTIPMEENGTGFSSGREVLRGSPNDDRIFAILLHAFVIEV